MNLQKLIEILLQFLSNSIKPRPDIPKSEPPKERPDTENPQNITEDKVIPDTAPQTIGPTQNKKWCAPIRIDKFRVTQKFLTPDSDNYPKTGHHPGTDYGTQGEDNVPLYFCADGEVIENGNNHKYFGNYFFFYVPEVNRTFIYFHLRDAAPSKGQYKAGQKCGITGQTGLSYGIHLHLECMKGRKTSSDRASLYTSKDALAAAAEDADDFIRSRI